MLSERTSVIMKGYLLQEMLYFAPKPKDVIARRESAVFTHGSNNIPQLKSSSDTTAHNSDFKMIQTKPSGAKHSGVGGRGTLLFGLYGDVPLDRVWYVLNKVYNLACLCPE